MTNKKNTSLITEYISNINVNIESAAFVHCPKDWHFENLCPEHNKFYFICEGTGWLKIKGKIYYPEVGDLFWLPANCKQSYATNPQDRYKKYWCHFFAQINNFELSDFINFPVLIKTKDFKFIKDLFSKFINYYYQDDITSQLMAKSSLMKIIAYYINNIPPEKLKLKEAKDIQNINIVLNYIEDNINNNLSIEQLAAIIHYHPNYFIKFFKNHLGKPPIQYINELRLNKAKKMLHSSNIRIQEIANNLGFNSITYFSNLFKKTTGFSPSEFRENK